MKEPAAGTGGAQIEDQPRYRPARAVPARRTSRAAGRPPTPADRRRSRGSAADSDTRPAHAASARRRDRRPPPARASAAMQIERNFRPMLRNGKAAISSASIRRAALRRPASSASSAANRARSTSGSTLRTIPPSIVREMAPVSSDTTMRNGVVLLGDADRGAMARSELTAQPRIDRERQKARRRGNSIALDDDRAVMQRRGHLERCSREGQRSAARRAGCRSRCSCAARSSAR